MDEEKGTEREAGKRGEPSRVVYSRLPTAEESDREQYTAGKGLASRIAREPVAPTLPVLLISFVLLVVLVFALGWRSESELS
ncbi:MAG: hypothetical protein M3268_10195, partial [Acidobacteriota bacterium]|nr:hypothetical protein [Acidobacteriota bacterium]